MSSTTIQAILSSVRSALAESILLAERPLRQGAELTQLVLAKVDDEDRKKMQLLGSAFADVRQEALRQKAKRLSCSELTVSSFEPVDAQCALHVMQESVGRLQESADSDERCAGSSEMATVAASILIQSLFLLDEEFCVSRGGYCNHPCVPSRLILSTTAASKFRSASENAKRLPHLQYRRLMAEQLRALSHHCNVSMRAFVFGGRPSSSHASLNGSMTPGEWLAKWKHTLDRPPNRSAAINTVELQNVMCRRLDWNQIVVRPLLGLMQVPISLKDLSVLVEGANCSSQSKRMPFRRWVELGLSEEYFGQLSQRKVDDSVVTTDLLREAKRLSLGGNDIASSLLKNPTQRRRNIRQLDKALFHAKASTTSIDKAKIDVVGISTCVFFVHPDALKESADTTAYIPGPHILYTVPPDEFEDKDIFVCPSSNEYFNGCLRPTILQLSETVPVTIVERPLRNDGEKWVSVDDLCLAVMWSYEIGEEVAASWMIALLKQFSSFVTVDAELGIVALRSK